LSSVTATSVTGGTVTTRFPNSSTSELQNDERLKTSMDRIDAREWTLPLIREKISALTESELSTELVKHGLPFSPIARPVDMFDDPHVNRPGGLIASRMADGRSFHAPGLPLEKDGEPVVGPSDVPGLGADTEAVLREAGCAEDLIAAVIGQGGKTA